MTRASFDVQAHEDKHSLYIPDLSFGGSAGHGWIEVKWVPNPGSVVNIPHMTKGQLAWLKKRHDAGGGNCYLLIGTPGHQFLVDRDFTSIVNKKTRYAALPGFVWDDLRGVVYGITGQHV